MITAYEGGRDMTYEGKEHPLGGTGEQHHLMTGLKGMVFSGGPKANQSYMASYCH